jgi:hypothetical protein
MERFGGRYLSFEDIRAGCIASISMVVHMWHAGASRVEVDLIKKHFLKSQPINSLKNQRSSSRLYLPIKNP